MPYINRHLPKGFLDFSSANNMRAIILDILNAKTEISLGRVLVLGALAK